MATDVEKLIVVLEAKANAFEKQMAKAANVAAQRSGEIKRRFDEMNKRSGTAFSGLDGSIARARAGLLQLGAAFAGVQGIEAAGRLADGYTRFANTLKTAGLEGQAFAQVEDDLFAAANRKGVEVESLGQVYARASLVAKSLGATQAQLKTFVDGVSAAVRIQGASTAAASGALLQLSQGLGSGVFRAEEFNSVLEGLPVIAQAVANNLDAAGGSVAKLRTLIAEGNVTSQDFFQAFLAGAGQLDGQAAKATLTLSGAFTVLENQLLRGAGAVDKATGATAILSGAITYLANNLGAVLPALAVVSAAFVGRLAPGILEAVKAGATYDVATRRLSISQSLAAKTGLDLARNEARAANATLDAAKADDAASRAALSRAQAERAKVAVLVSTIDAEMRAANAQRFRNQVPGVYTTEAGRTKNLAGAAVDAQQIAATRKLLTVADTELAAAEAKVAATSAVVATAQTAATAAIARTTVAARAGALALRGYAALSGLLGGPVGIVLTAVAATFAIYTARAAAAEAQTEEVNKILDRLGVKARDAAAGLNETATALRNLPIEQRRADLRKLQEELSALTTSIRAGRSDANFNELLDDLRGLDEIDGTAAGEELRAIVRGARDGKGEASDLLARLDKIAALDISTPVDDLLSRIRASIVEADRLRRGIAVIGAPPEPSYVGRADREGIPVSPEAGQRRVFQEALSEAGRTSLEQEIAAETKRLKERYEERGQVVPEAARLADEARQLVERRNAVAEGERNAKKKAEPSDIPMQDAADQFFRLQVQQRQGLDDLRSSYAAETAEVTFNTAALSKNERDRAVALETYKLEQQYLEQGVTNLGAYRGEIAALAEARVAANETNARAVEVMRQEQEMWDFLGQQGVTALTDIITNSKNATDAVENLGKALANAALQAALLGTGPLAGLFGTSGATGGNGGLFSLIGAGISGLFSGGGYGTGSYTGIESGGFIHRAGGGDVQAGRAYVVGEKRPELFVPGRSGTIIPNIPDAAAINRTVDRASPQPRRIETSFRQTIDLRGANGDETIARIAREEAQKGAAMAIRTSDQRFAARLAKNQKYGR